jgi:uncharacterized protein (DUF302 family)
MRAALTPAITWMLRSSGDVGCYKVAIQPAMGDRMMRKGLVLAVSLLVAAGSVAGAAAEDPAIIAKRSAHDVAATVQRLGKAIEARGAKIVATVDHAAAATAAGLELRPTTLVIFGNPKLGTPLMQSRQTAGLDLPLRVLVWEDETGVVHVGYWPVERIRSSHDIRDRDEVIERMTMALDGITAEAAAK